MGTDLTQARRKDPRWDEVCASLPAVRRWLELVAQLVGELEPGVPSETLDLNVGVSPSVGRTLAGMPGVADDLAAPPSSVSVSLGRPVDSMPDDVDERVRLRLLFEQYETCQEELSSRQWRTVCLRFRDGLTQSQIGVTLKKSRSSVHGLLKRAHQVKEAYRQRLRSERYRLARKNLNP